MREELSILRGELVVLQRTEQILKGRDKNLEEFLVELERKKGIEVKKVFSFTENVVRCFVSSGFAIYYTNYLQYIIFHLTLLCFTSIGKFISCFYLKLNRKDAARKNTVSCTLFTFFAVFPVCRQAGSWLITAYLYIPPLLLQQNQYYGIQLTGRMFTGS